MSESLNPPAMLAPAPTRLIQPQADQAPLDLDLRQRLYAGELMLLPARAASLQLVVRAHALLCAEIGTSYPESLHEIWSPSRLHQAVSHVRRLLPQDAELRAAYLALFDELGLNLAEWRIDQPRLRAVIPGAEQVPAAAPMYYAHRDTWYANPSAQINLWIPLADYPAVQNFVFWPECFNRVVPNDSAGFDYVAWKQQTGFQNPHAPAGSAYPRALELAPIAPTGFACRRGELLLFSAAQLHQTLANPGPQLRFSLDLRLVCLVDTAAGLGAADGDNRSQGSTLTDYVYLGAGAT